MRKRYKFVSNNSIYRGNLSYARDIENPSVLYNGSVKPDEDPADYYRKLPKKAVRLG
ncbi:hypothetical protein D3C84_1248270 [compost metagenome]